MTQEKESSCTLRSLYRCLQNPIYEGKLLQFLKDSCVFVLELGQKAAKRVKKFQSFEKVVQIKLKKISLAPIVSLHQEISLAQESYVTHRCLQNPIYARLLNQKQLYLYQISSNLGKKWYTFVLVVEKKNYLGKVLVHFWSQEGLCP